LTLAAPPGNFLLSQKQGGVLVAKSPKPVKAKATAKNLEKTKNNKMGGVKRMGCE
jgi:hypothetical protein